ncbi:hypothetical protein RF11_08530 [Thelohanellus kitauei]|uniref:Uncharacterized protein n=1 Tax=Thelohanellus kitauei TaxID=669202 RepID=A0A0C2MRY4_THEKT|nr:hypothetical protein RF11_08530 [Thelohanellus kitauei]
MLPLSGTAPASNRVAADRQKGMKDPTEAPRWARQLTPAASLGTCEDWLEGCCARPEVALNYLMPLKKSGITSTPSPPTWHPLFYPSPPVNYDLTRLLCDMDAVVNVQASKHRKIPQAKFEKWVGR